MTDDSLDLLLHMLSLPVSLDVVIPQPHTEVLHVILAHAEKIFFVRTFIFITLGNINRIVGVTAMY